MKSANNIPKYRADMFLEKTNDLLEAQLMFASIELDLFRLLKTPITLDDAVKKTGYHKRNLKLLLNALTSIGFLKKVEQKYVSIDETDYFLNPDSEMYLGDHILYWRDMTHLGNVGALVKNGPQEITFKDENGSDFFDFRSMGQGARNLIYLGRVQKLITTAKRFFKENETFKVFDMGAGSGIMSIEIVRNFPNANAVVFDQPKVIELTKEIIEDYKVEHKIKTQSGNFVTDSFTDKYDLIIASGVLDFVGDLDKMLLKLRDSLTENGYIYITTHGINEDFTGPKNYILGWLSSQFNGLNIIKSSPIIKKTIIKSGFEIVYENEDGLTCMIRKSIK